MPDSLKVKAMETELYGMNDRVDELKVNLQGLTSQFASVPSDTAMREVIAAMVDIQRVVKQIDDMRHEIGEQRRNDAIELEASLAPIRERYPAFDIVPKKQRGIM